MARLEARFHYPNLTAYDKTADHTPWSPQIRFELRANQPEGIGHFTHDSGLSVVLLRGQPVSVEEEGYPVLATAFESLQI